MNILFKNSFILTEELLLECRIAFISKWDILIGFFSLFLTLFGVIFLEHNLQLIMGCTLFICSSISILFIFPILKAKKMYNQLLIINNNRPANETVNFYNDMIESISESGMKISISYDNIKKIHNKENMLVFLSKQNLVIFVKKDGFVHDTYDDFKDFIYNKSNLKL